jgi:hypothetical protein
MARNSPPPGPPDTKGPAHRLTLRLTLVLLLRRPAGSDSHRPAGRDSLMQRCSATVLPRDTRAPPPSAMGKKQHSLTLFHFSSLVLHSLHRFSVIDVFPQASYSAFTLQ